MADEIGTWEEFSEKLSFKEILDLVLKTLNSNGGSCNLTEDVMLRLMQNCFRTLSIEFKLDDYYCKTRTITVASGTISSITLPSEMEVLSTITYNDDKCCIPLLASESTCKPTGTGAPSKYSLMKNKITLDCIPDKDATLEVVYYRKATFKPFEIENDTRCWLYPDLPDHVHNYLYKCTLAFVAAQQGDLGVSDFWSEKVQLEATADRVSSETKILPQKEGPLIFNTWIQPSCCKGCGGCK